MRRNADQVGEVGASGTGRGAQGQSALEGQHGLGGNFSLLDVPNGGARTSSLALDERVTLEQGQGEGKARGAIAVP